MCVFLCFLCVFPSKIKRASPPRVRACSSTAPEGIPKRQNAPSRSEGAGRAQGGCRGTPRLPYSHHGVMTTMGLSGELARWATLPAAFALIFVLDHLVASRTGRRAGSPSTPSATPSSCSPVSTAGTARSPTRSTRCHPTSTQRARLHSHREASGPSRVSDGNILHANATAIAQSTPSAPSTLATGVCSLLTHTVPVLAILCLLRAVINVLHVYHLTFFDLKPDDKFHHFFIPLIGFPAQFWEWGAHRAFMSSSSPASRRRRLLNPRPGEAGQDGEDAAAQDLRVAQSVVPWPRHSHRELPPVPIVCPRQEHRAVGGAAP